MRRTPLLAALLLLLAPAPIPAPAALSAPAASAWFDGGEVGPVGGAFRDEHGREVVLRGFNVSGTAKLAEHRGLPFPNAQAARDSAAALRQLTGANAVRFLVTWAWLEPEPRRIDQAYLDRVAEQVGAFTDQGVRVYVDFHQDLYSRHVFNRDSWYTGDGAPAWVVRAGGYPAESCGLCFHWGQNMKSNTAVTAATYDFWHNRELQVDGGPLRVQDEFLSAAGEALRGLKNRLSAEAFELVLGVDPLNEPYAGRYDAGQTGLTWERDHLWPFHQRFRRLMDEAGWRDKTSFAEPLVFWNQNVEFFAEPGGFPGAEPWGDGYAFNTHFYDGKAQSGLLMPGKAGDGQYARTFADVRTRAAELGTPAIVSEYGHPVRGLTADKHPSVLKATQQSLDSALPGSRWWAEAAASGPVLSGSQWHWDTNYDRHRELMNDNPSKVKTDGDAMNDEHFSVVRVGDDGAAGLTVDARLVDRVFPRAVAGTTRAFTYEDRARDGNAELVWNQVPAGMPAVRGLVGANPYAVLVWEGAESAAPTELHLPAGFAPQGTSVVTDFGAVTGLPGDTGVEAVAWGPEPGVGGVNRLLLRAGAGVHFALVTTGTGDSTAAQRELADWAARTF